MAKKDTYYFSHDCNARRDDKIIALRIRHKWEGYGLFWGIIEHLREAENYECVRDYNIIAYDLRVGADIIKSIVEDFGLFSFTEDGKRFYSERLKKDMNVKDEISEKARKSVQARWRYNIENKEFNTSVIRTNNERNTGVILIEENRRKENNKESIPNGIPKKIADANAPAPMDKKIEVENKAPRFLPPTIEEVSAYCNERQNGIDAQHFVDFYAAKNWMIGKNKMKDWRAAVRTWERNRTTYGQQSGIRSSSEQAYGSSSDGYSSTI